MTAMPRIREVMSQQSVSLRRDLLGILFVAAEVTRLTSKPGAKTAKEDRAFSRRLLQDPEVFHDFASAVLKALTNGKSRASETDQAGELSMELLDRRPPI